MTSTYRSKELQTLEETAALYSELIATYNLARDFRLASQYRNSPTYVLTVSRKEWNEHLSDKFAVFRVAGHVSIETYMFDMYFADACRIIEKLGLPELTRDAFNVLTAV